MQKIYVTWQGSGLCGYGGGEFRLTLEEAEKELREWCERDNMIYSPSIKGSAELNECSEPFHYIQTLEVSDDVLWGIEVLLNRIQRLEDRFEKYRNR